MTILLDPYAARSCPVKTQNTYDPSVEAPTQREDQTMVEVFLGSQQFKDAVFAEVVTAPDVRDLRQLPPGADRLAATDEALSAGAAVVIAPRLRPDVVGHRRGSPDLLVRHGVTAAGRPGYLPVQVKRHRVLENRTSSTAHLALAALSDPGPGDPSETTPVAWRNHREPDLLQVAHHWRMLEAHGLAPEGPARAGVVGTDLVEGRHVVVWVDLTAKILRTFSRTAAQGWRLRSALERYDHEFGFRVAVAQRASSNVDGSVGPIVAPIRVRECESCPWWERCAPMLPEDDLSLRIDKAPLDVREISVLRRLGVATLADLVNADLEALLPAYLPEVRHRDRAEERLRLTARRARMLQEGVALQRTSSGTLVLPQADLEVDVDIETAADDSIYLWGFLVDDLRTDDPPTYHAFASFGHLDLAQEEALAIEAISWLTALIEGRRAVVYHYSDYELVHLRKMAERTGHPLLTALLDRRRDVFHDLFLTVRDHFFGVRGLGLKVVAAEGPGFSWRDPDPSGLASQTWFAQACDADNPTDREAARTRVLEYNEDDVRATHALRRWLRASAPSSD